MARAPTSGRPLFNIMSLVRGNINTGESNIPVTQAFGSPDILTGDARRRMVVNAERVITNRTQVSTASSMMNAVTGSLSKVGQERLEYRKILQLMPEVAKAARLMIASILSPNDLARKNITVTFNQKNLSEEIKAQLTTKATEFFQDKLKLKTALSSWIYQFGYESGSAVFAVIPMTSFEKIHDESFIGTESLQKNVLNPTSQDTLFGFGDTSTTQRSFSQDAEGLESIVNKYTVHDPFFKDRTVPSTFSSDMVKMMIGQEALSLSDNPAILQIKKEEKKRRSKSTSKKIADRYKMPVAQTVVSIASDKEDAPTDNPLLIRLPPESVTVIHTPGDPSDHQGYLVLLDQSGNPITAVMQEKDQQNLTMPGSQSVINQSYNAYGFNNSTAGVGGHTHQEMTERLYNQVIGEHLRSRLKKSGFDHTELGNTDAIFRCMFSRFLQQKQTRILFLPRDLVTYMTFEMDEFGYGVSRLEGVKFNIGMKMAIQVSRVLATIKAAMDKRRIEVKFTDNMLEQPEQIIQSVIQQYIRKNSFSFSYDPNIIQNQIAAKSISVQGIDVPGMEQFGLTNEPDTRAQPLTTDESALDYQDKSILNGLRMPAAAMNSLDENEYSRSVVTTNLFFSMDVSIDQDTTIACASDLLRKYATFSKEFQDMLRDVLTKSEADNDKANEGQIADLIAGMIITLPLPNVAPSKSQFESLEAMISSITSTINSAFPDEYAGGNPDLLGAIALLRTNLISSNVANYLAGSGMTGLNIPSTNFAQEIGDLSKLIEGLQNISSLIETKKNLVSPAPDPAAGY